MTRSLAALSGKIIDGLVDTVCVVDAEGRFVFVNAACEQLLGYKPDELIGRNMIEYVHPDDRERTLAAAMVVMSGQPHVNFENRYIRKDGSIVEILWSARWSEEDQARIAVARDITDLNRVARRQEAMYRISEMAQSDEGLLALYNYVRGFVARLLPVDRFFVTLYDQGRSKLVFPYFFDGEERVQEAIPLRKGSLVDKVIETKKSVLANSSDSKCPVTEPATGRYDYDWLGAPLVTEYGVKGALVVQVRSGNFSYCEEDLDLLQFVANQVGSAINRKRQEARLHHMAHHDPLTNLPNRTLFRDRVRVALTQARRNEEGLVLLYLDLCNFKTVNDSLGHAAGDKVLREIALRIKACVRESDTVCRMGGDEFTVLLNNLHNGDNPRLVSEKIRGAISAPLELDGKLFKLEADIGMAVYPGHGEDVDQLLRHADAAMYQSKKSRLEIANEREQRQTSMA